MKIIEKYWKEFDKIGIDRNLVEIQECGIWFKNIGASLCATDEQKKELVNLNTKIQGKL